MDYTATTTNASNKISVSAESNALIRIEVNGNLVENGNSVAWKAGENIVTISVSEPGKAPAEYNIIVTKS